MLLLNYIRLFRVEHWVKNVLVFMPPFFLGVMFRQDMLVVSIPAFLSFSLTASAVYAINDIADRERDRMHPTKCRRPIASGVISVRAAAVAVFAMCGLAFLMTAWAHATRWAILVLAMYLASNLAYSSRFKNTPLVDIFLLAFGFVFRIFYGGFYFGVEISSWLFLCIFSGALYFACGKRKNEIARVGVSRGSRNVLRFYSQKFLDAHYYMFCCLSILFYCLWTISRTDQHAVGKLALTIPIVVFILTRYNYLVESDKSDGDPVPVLLHDRWLMLAVAVFGILNFIVLYFGMYIPKVRY